MKLLYISTHQAWPLTTGSRLRNYHLARQLATRCSVTFFELIAPSDDASARPPADSGFERVVTARRTAGYSPGLVLRGIAGPLPLTVLNYWSGTIAEKLAGVLRDDAFDFVHVASIHLYPYTRMIRETAPHTALLHDYHNIESELMYRYSQSVANPLKRCVARRTAGLLESLERKAEGECEALIVPSDREREQVLQRSPAAKVHTIPNGVDTRHFDECFHSTTGLRHDVLFVGSMDYHANIEAVRWFVRETWPAIAARNPELRFVIVGRSPAPEVRALASERVIVTGTVDDVRPYYTGALAAIVPLRVGSGTRTKILEAMAAGVPVISTRLGVEGIEAVHGTDLLLADIPSEMAAAVRELAASAALHTRMREAARRFVLSRYDWSISGDRLFSIYHNLSKNTFNNK